MSVIKHHAFYLSKYDAKCRRIISFYWQEIWKEYSNTNAKHVKTTAVASHKYKCSVDEEMDYWRHKNGDKIWETATIATLKLSQKSSSILMVMFMEAVTK